jgi:hypothetical protein
MLNLPRRAMVDCLMAVLILGAPAAAAAGKEPPPTPITREKVRLNLLDNCVMDQWKTRDAKDKIADQCKCAAAKVSHQLSDADIKGFKDKLPRTAAPMWDAAMKYCLNPPRPKPPAAAAKAEEPAKTDAGAAAPAAAAAGATDNAATGSTDGATPAPAQ